MPKPILVVCSVDLEMEPLRVRLRAATERRVGRIPLWEGTIGTAPVLALVAGMGKTNASHALTAVLERTEVAGMIGFGVGGAYPGSGLEVGDLAVATAENYGDEGVSTPGGWISCEGIGIPLVSSAVRPIFNRFPVDEPALPALRKVLEELGFPFREGEFVTVSCCSGTAARGAELAERFRGICESMEGAAYAHLAALYDLPFLEVRGISNLVEDRDLSRWRLEEAASVAAEAVAAVLPAWAPAPAELREVSR